jgi:hypothetical protein
VFCGSDAALNCGLSVDVITALLEFRNWSCATAKFVPCIGSVLSLRNHALASQSCPGFASTDWVTPDPPN